MNGGLPGDMWLEIISLCSLLDMPRIARLNKYFRDLCRIPLNLESMKRNYDDPIRQYELLQASMESVNDRKRAVAAQRPRQASLPQALFERLYHKYLNARKKVLLREALQSDDVVVLSQACVSSEDLKLNLSDDRSLNTLLHQVARYKAFNVLVAVVSCKSVNVSAFVNAFFVSENHNGQSAYALVKGDLPSNVKASIVSWCQEEQAGVIKALLRGFIPAEELAEILEFTKVDPNTLMDPSQGKFPLHCATRSSQVLALVTAGADVTLLDAHGWTPFYAALYYQKFDVLHAFIDCNSPVEADFANLAARALLSWDASALPIATKYSILKQLVIKGADPRRIEISMLNATSAGSRLLLTWLILIGAHFEPDYWTTRDYPALVGLHRRNYVPESLDFARDARCKKFRSVQRTISLQFDEDGTFVKRVSKQHILGANWSKDCSLQRGTWRLEGDDRLVCTLHRTRTNSAPQERVYAISWSYLERPYDSASVLLVQLPTPTAYTNLDASHNFPLDFDPAKGAEVEGYVFLTEL